MTQTTASENILHKVRKLITKANGTDIEAERLTFLTKAQEMMQKHAITQAQIDALKDPSEAKRTPIDITVEMPKIVGKSAMDSLAVAVAETNRGFVIKTDRGEKLRFTAMPGDAEFIELLFTSLILNAEIAYERVKDERPEWTHPRTYKANFYEGYAERVIKRIKEDAKTREIKSTGTDLVLLKNVQEQVYDHVRAEHGIAPRYRSRRVDTSYCASGHAHGQRAGNKADLSGGSRRGISERKMITE